MTTQKPIGSSRSRIRHMAFRFPNLNLQCSVWQAYNPFTQGLPPQVDPFLKNVPCQLRLVLNTLLPLGADFDLTISAFILFVAHRDIRSGAPGVQSDVVECPSGTGRFYKVLGVEDRGKGFPNEHRVALCRQLTDVVGGWRYPTP